MTISDKQLQANRENAPKGGVKTAEGKEIIKYNALKHGLLAKEVVIKVGDGAESQEEFDALLTDLQNQLKPEGTLEEMLVEKLAVSYWRLRRAYRYEVGLIREKLDNATDNYYKIKTSSYSEQTENKTDHEIDNKIQESEQEIKVWKEDKKKLSEMHKEGKGLEEIYDWEGNWEWLQDKFEELLEEVGDDQPETIRKTLNKEGWSDDKIWEAHIELCDERAEALEQEIVTLEKDKIKNKLQLQVMQKKGSIPSKEDLERLLRYETAIERQFYKAINQLERLQRLRAGDNVPAPVELNMNLNT